MLRWVWGAVALSALFFEGAAAFQTPSSFVPVTALRTAQPQLCTTSRRSAPAPAVGVESWAGALGLSATVAGSESDFRAEIKSARELLVKASVTKSEDQEAVCDALESMEQNMRKLCKEDAAAADELIKNLNGSWRLIFTTGTKETQKKWGRKVSYFPLKATQSFDTSTMEITNGIFVGDLAVMKFFGEFEFNLKSRKLEFDFDAIALLGFKINLPKGKAAELGSATGLGSSNNVDMVERQGKKPFFNWISADADIATARGGGGGLALWRRCDDA